MHDKIRILLNVNSTFEGNKVDMGSIKKIFRKNFGCSKRTDRFIFQKSAIVLIVTHNTTLQLAIVNHFDNEVRIRVTSNVYGFDFNQVVPHICGIDVEYLNIILFCS